MTVLVPVQRAELPKMDSLGLDSHRIPGISTTDVRWRSAIAAANCRSVDPKCYLRSSPAFTPAALARWARYPRGGPMVVELEGYRLPQQRRF